MKKIVFFFLFLISAFCYAQTTGAYLNPRNIFVGDHASLILPLPPSAQNRDDIVLSSGIDYLPLDPDIDIHKITLEQRVTGSRLIIEFTSFIPGIIELPGIEIGGEHFSGLTATVNSTIEAETSPSLSEPASALAVPGTAFMLYGALAVIAVILIIIIIFITKGRALYKYFSEKWKRHRLFSLMRKTEKELLKSVIKKADSRIIIDKLSDEFRKFLSVLININCSSMTPDEFKELPAEIFNTSEDISSFLFKFFHKCDEIRFSGISIDSQEIILLLHELRWFLDLMEIAAKERTEEKQRDY
ncbi:MAG: hypothetical protein FWB73_02030 [Treponema sp.]|nr:hypothetical protein [Treponema sp.]